MAAFTLAALGGLIACQPKLNAGDWSCPPDDAGIAATTGGASASGATGDAGAYATSDAGPNDAGPNDAGAVAAANNPVTLPWSTGFENRFCSYSQPIGFCYGDTNASHLLVTSPVRSGRYAAAFTVNTDDPNAHQSRCVREGRFPTAAYYEAWYRIPIANHIVGSANWNLFFFQGADNPQATQHPLWSITLVNGSNGGLNLIAYNPLNGPNKNIYPVNPTVAVPIDTWFHIQFFLKRAANATGEVALWQDGVLLFDAKNLITDDSTWGQWYLGNLATALMPAESTVYVDDVSITATR